MTNNKEQQMGNQYGEEWLDWAVKIEEEANCDISAGSISMLQKQHEASKKPILNKKGDKLDIINKDNL